MKYSIQQLYTISQSVRGAKENTFNVQSKSLITFTLSQSVSGAEEDQRRPSVYSHSICVSVMSGYRHHNESSKFYNFVGRATQPGQGESHGECQAEGCYISQSLQGEGSVTPAHTTDHVDQAQLHRHVVEELHNLCLQLQLQEDAQGGGETTLIHINAALAI